MVITMRLMFDFLSIEVIPVVHNDIFIFKSMQMRLLNFFG